MIKTADWVVDMGPEGGSGGGLVVAEGTPEQVASVPASHTGKFLREVLEAGKDQRCRTFCEGAGEEGRWPTKGGNQGIEAGGLGSRASPRGRARHTLGAKDLAEERTIPAAAEIQLACRWVND
ncbi:UvrABC system protein A [Streptomyces hirsutus]